ncbi:hypothetical protein HXX76_005043 [Chlamydomonas incerta]|uniref:Uncharacterized protein n=1 Tax=Chlamydomonas incerta TaxID=51695 RepID=A0A835W7K1_CHLIN|nr:hypothetical protein HXX76_005043 [Chlamydomonas incerta]|eukprot:KAG2438491.1 hypothetical protein HXX76_005043 [Chlamydomonas incerta]
MSSDPLARARGAVESLLGPAGARKFDDNDLLRLKNAGYESLEDLVAATPAGLARAELRPARADLIIRAQASTAGLGVGTASGAAASAANQGAVPLLGTDDDGSWFWVLFRHFAAAADRYPSPHRRMQRGGLQAHQMMRQHQD